MGKVIDQRPEARPLTETCRVCGRRFTSKTGLRIHFRVHKDHPYDPDAQVMTFEEIRSTLAKHMGREDIDPSETVIVYDTRFGSTVSGVTIFLR